MKLRVEPVLFLLFISLFLVTGCVRENSDDCDCPAQSQGLEVYFYSKSSCQTDTIFPGDIKDILFAIFNRNDVLEYFEEVDDVELNREYKIDVEIGTGLYTTVAWSGISDENCEISQLQDGVLNKQDLVFRLKREEGRAYPMKGTRLYYGEGSAVYIADESGNQKEEIAINMLEITNRIRISVEGIEDPENIEIVIESNNGSMNMNGTIAEDGIIDYPGEYTVGDDWVEVDFTVLKLQTGYTNNIIIRDTVNDTELYNGNLLGTLLLKNPDVNLDCDHDFVINFTAQDQCDCGTYVITEIWVNNWLVHSYERPM